MTELEPCPFCGPRMVEPDIVQPDLAPRRWQVICGGCGASSGHTATRCQAISAWNTRPKSEAEELLEWLNANGGLLMCDEEGCLVQVEGIRKERDNPLDALRAAREASDD